MDTVISRPYEHNATLGRQFRCIRKTDNLANGAQQVN